jgi:hypothetical protein
MPATRVPAMTRGSNARATLDTGDDPRARDDAMT